jgi:FRG domain
MTFARLAVPASSELALMTKMQIALISEVPDLNLTQLGEAAAAFRKQISTDFGPHWGEGDAEILVCASLDERPQASWPLIIRKDIDVVGAAAYHTLKDGSPYSLVAYSPTWTLAASHQILEILVSPLGDRLITGRSMKPGEERKKVHYLVQVCDPCQGEQFAYRIDDILVSDFCTPQFFDAEKQEGVRYDQTGAIRYPLEVLENGFISWWDEDTGHWWQRTRFGGQDAIRDLGPISTDEQPEQTAKPNTLPEAVELTITHTIAILQKKTETKEQLWQKETEGLILKYRIGRVGVTSPWIELTPITPDDFYQILNRISDTQLFVFRGHANRTWPHLITSLHRTVGKVATPAEEAKLEAEAITAFRRHGRSLLPHSELAYFDRILDGVTLMQHYGAPTRLLDWTLSPWVAAYFAVSEEASAEEDGVIWAFNQAKLVKCYFTELEANKPEYRKFEAFIFASKVEEWLRGALEQSPVINTFRYQYANPQMGAQQSLFTICGTVDEHHDIALERVLRDDWDKLKIVIPAGVKHTLRQRLFLMNVNALSLFPNLRGVGLHILEATRSGFPLGDEGLLYLLEKKQSEVPSDPSRSPGSDV